MTVTITINCDNDAFTPKPEPEIARILRELADKVEDRGLESNYLRDWNGNRTGRIEIDPS